MTALQDASSSCGQNKLKLAHPAVSDHMSLFKALEMSKQGIILIFIPESGKEIVVLRDCWRF